MNHFVLGFASYRDGNRGTPFIEALVEAIEQHAHNTKLMDIAKRVIMHNN